MFSFAAYDDWYNYLPTQATGCYTDEYKLDNRIDRLVGRKIKVDHGE